MQYGRSIDRRWFPDGQNQTFNQIAVIEKDMKCQFWLDDARKENGNDGREEKTEFRFVERRKTGSEKLHEKNLIREKFHMTSAGEILDSRKKFPIQSPKRHTKSHKRKERKERERREETPNVSVL